MTRLITLTLAFGMTATTLVLAQAPRSIEAQFKAAQHAEEVEGDLQEGDRAVSADRTRGDRAAAVRALLRVAECYQKLGDAEARAVYQRIIRDYGEQPQAAEARSRLNDLVGADKPVDTHVVARQVWVGDGVNVEGSPSADGKFLTFIDWNSSDTGNVAIRDLTTGRNQRLTNATGADGYAYDPAISPDGKQIAYMFFGERTTSLRTVGVDGGPPRVIARLGPHATYQPGGRPMGDGWLRLCATQATEPGALCL